MPFRGGLFKHTAFFENESILYSPTRQLIIKKGDFLLMPFLVLNIFNHINQIRFAIRKGTITTLPIKFIFHIPNWFQLKYLDILFQI